MQAPTGSPSPAQPIDLPADYDQQPPAARLALRIARIDQAHQRREHELNLIRIHLRAIKREGLATHGAYRSFEQLCYRKWGWRPLYVARMLGETTYPRGGRADRRRGNGRTPGLSLDTKEFFAPYQIGEVERSNGLPDNLNLRSPRPLQLTLIDPCHDAYLAGSALQGLLDTLLPSLANAPGQWRSDIAARHLTRFTEAAVALHTTILAISQ